MELRRPLPFGGERRGFWFAALWLFFLAEPLLAAWRRRDTVEGDVGLVLTVVFATLYLTIWAQTRSRRLALQQLDLPGSRWQVGGLAVLGLLGAGMVATIGEEGLTSLVYLAVGCVICFRPRVAAPLVLALMLVAVGAGLTEPWGSQVGLAFSVGAASVAVYGVRAMIGRQYQLMRERDRNAELAVENERTRFARDLHDILGHSLTVITVKAELARRLLPTDPERAERELADLERLSRDAMADVRRAVDGYREITLPGELARARTALEAAGIAPDVPNTTDEVPSELRDLFAWTVREGVTNVIRHSDAGRCAVVLTATSAEVRDDGSGADPDDADPGAADHAGRHGAGLTGLRERAAEVGATLVVSRLDPGFSLRVAVAPQPVVGEPDADDPVVGAPIAGAP